jgi:hypothetical protein
LRTVYILLLTKSPFLFDGGNQDTIIFVLDAGIALMSLGADGAEKERFYNKSAYI